MTEFKAPHKIDCAQDNLILAGFEDGSLRVFDIREGVKAMSSSKRYSQHDRMINTVCFNPNVENVFTSGGHDGKVLVWDLRNDEAPIANLKIKTKQDDYRVFSTAWNGSSTILSGGSDSHISAHTIE